MYTTYKIKLFPGQSRQRGREDGDHHRGRADSRRLSASSPLHDHGTGHQRKVHSRQSRSQDRQNGRNDGNGKKIGKSSLKKGLVEILEIMFLFQLKPKLLCLLYLQ